MSSSDEVIVIGLISFSIFGVIASARGLRSLKDPQIAGRFTEGGLRGAKVYYRIGLICGAFMFLFLSYKLAEHLLAQT